MNEPERKRRGPIGIAVDFYRDEPGCAGVIIFWILLGTALGVLTSLGFGPLANI